MAIGGVIGAGTILVLAVMLAPLAIFLIALWRIGTGTLQTASAIRGLSATAAESPAPLQPSSPPAPASKPVVPTKSNPVATAFAVGAFVLAGVLVALWWL